MDWEKGGHHGSDPGQRSERGGRPGPKVWNALSSQRSLLRRDDGGSGSFKHKHELVTSAQPSLHDAVVDGHLLSLEEGVEAAHYARDMPPGIVRAADRFIKGIAEASLLLAYGDPATSERTGEAAQPCFLLHLLLCPCPAVPFARTIRIPRAMGQVALPLTTWHGLGQLRGSGILLRRRPSLVVRQLPVLVMADVRSASSHRPVPQGVTGITPAMSTSDAH
jgi:hypothetical protein